MDISDAEKVLMWNKWMLNTLGLWPLKGNDYLLLLSFIFVTFHCCLAYADLAQHISDLRYVLANLTESIIFVVTSFKIGLYRMNRKRLSAVLKDISKDFAKELYTTATEEALFLKYYSMSKLFIKCIMVASPATIVLYFLRPLAGRIVANYYATGNASIAYILPYRIRLFFDLTEARTYYIIYACEAVQLPIIAVGYTATNCFLVTLILHVCGQFSVLACQAKNIVHDPEGFHSGMKRIVIKHHRLISTANNLTSAVAYLLLFQLIGITMLICLVGYNLVANLEIRHDAQLITFIFYIVSMVVELFGFCLIGECLKTESLSMSDAFYNCKWCNVPSIDAKLLVICISRSQKAVILTAGGFYTFTLESFTDVMKTSMAYLSVLRNFL